MSVIPWSQFNQILFDYQQNFVVEWVVPSIANSSPAPPGGANTPATETKTSGLGTIIFQAEFDLVGLVGFEGGFGVAFNTNDWSQSGVFGTFGIAAGANLGISFGAGIAFRGVEGTAFNVDTNLSKFSPTISYDSEGWNGFSIGVGPGIGLSTSITKTNIITTQEILNEFKYGVIHLLKEIRSPYNIK